MILVGEPVSLEACGGTCLKFEANAENTSLHNFWGRLVDTEGGVIKHQTVFVCD